MRRTSILTLMILISTIININAQTSFSNLNFPEYITASSGNKLMYGTATFGNTYNEEWNSSSGFSVSKVQDTVTAGFMNQYASRPGEGAENSEVYMICNGSTGIHFSAATNLSSVKLTNSTYAYLSMMNGDDFAKKFGGEDGNDPDWFKVTIKGYKENTLTDSVDFYLADFRFEDNSEDYIVKEWKNVDLTSLGEIDSLSFSLSSSDVGQYGMNTPAYFCLDNLQTASETLTFEDTDFDYWNGADRKGLFMSDSITFYNNYAVGQYGVFWNGFAYSKKTDVTTPGFTNQYSAITGEGVDGEENYAVAYSSANMKFSKAGYVKLTITNSTYAYLSMKNGDSFAKKFGGEDGNDPDWFKVKVKGYKDNVLLDSMDIYLADFRFEDNSEDYILKEWKEFDLNELGAVDSLSFSFSSTDVGQFGMNTPAYFCLGKVGFSSTESVNDMVAENHFNVYPNPANDYITLNEDNIEQLVITDLTGKTVQVIPTVSRQERIDISNLAQGVYMVSYKANGQSINGKLIKR